MAKPRNQTLSPSSYTWLVVSVAFAAFMSKLDSNIVNISLPAIAAHFNASTSEVSRIVIVYLLVTTSFLLLAGKLGDRFGFKRVFLGGYAIFTLGSLTCGLAWSIQALVLSRFVQGIGGAMLVSSAYAIIPKFLPKEKVGWGFGLLTTGVAFGIALGAPLGGLINQHFSWRWVFLVNIPIGIFAIYAAKKSIPADKLANIGKGLKFFDIPGVIFSLLGLSLLLLAVNQGNELGWGSRTIIIYFTLAALLLTLFVLWELKQENPLLSFSLMKNRQFVFANLAAFFGYMALSGQSFLIPFYLVQGKHCSPDQTGFLIMISSMMLLLVSPVAGRMSDKIKPAIICVLAMLSAVGAMTLFSFTLAAASFIPVVVFLAWFPASLGMFTSPNNNQAMTLAPPGQRGMASGLFNTINSLGMVMGVTLFETIFARVLPPSRVDHGMLKSVAAPKLMSGFTGAFAFGAVVCLIAMIFSSLNLRKSRIAPKNTLDNLKEYQVVIPEQHTL